MKKYLVILKDEKTIWSDLQLVVDSDKDLLDVREYFYDEDNIAKLVKDNFGDLKDSNIVLKDVIILSDLTHINI